MLRMFCARDEWEKVSVGTNLGFWCDACPRAEGAGAYLVRLQHVGNLSTHLLLHLLHPSGVRALHTQRGDRGSRRARVRNGVRFFVPRAEGRREGGAHGGDAQGGTAVQRRAGASARCLRGGTHTRYARGGANRRHHAHDRRHRVTCPRVPTKVRCRRLQLETDQVARSENFRASFNLVNPRPTTFEKRQMQTAAPATSRRARVGEEARPSRANRRTFAARALLGCQRTVVRAARRVKASPLSEKQRLVLKLEGFSLNAQRVRRGPR